MLTSKHCLEHTHRHDTISSIVVFGGDAVELDNNNHSVFLMYYHLVLVIKYRRKVIDDKTSNRLKEIFESIAPSYNVALQEWNHDKDHVHILFKAQPNSDCRSSSMPIRAHHRVSSKKNIP